MQRCFVQTVLAATLATLVVPNTAFATVYQIQIPTSTYEYLVPPEGPGIAGCQPDDFHCLFGIAGTLEFEIDLLANNGAFVGANLQLTGNEGVGSGFFDGAADGLEDFLISLGPIPLESAVGGDYLFREPVPMPPAIRWNSLEVRINGDQFSLSGAYDQTFVDGAGHAFNVTGVEVPEPMCGTMTICCIAVVSFVKRRHVRC